MSMIFNSHSNYNISYHRSNFYKTLYDTTKLPYHKMFNNCINYLCYTQSKGNNYIYKPHNNYGRVGTTTTSYLASKNRL